MDAFSAAAVQRMQEYIEAHLFERLTLFELAREAGYSQYHAARMFREHTGRPPFEYIRARRLTKAALELRDNRERVLDVALDFMFDSQEGFTRAFSREFGIAPHRYSKLSPPIRLFMPYKALDSYKAMHREEQKKMEKTNTKAIFVQIVERPKRKAIVKRGVKAEDYFEFCGEVGCEIWPVLLSVKEALYEPVAMWLPEKLIKPGTSKYVQGVEVPEDYSNTLPEGYELMELEPCKLMVFQGEPYDDADFGEAIGEVWEHIERFDPKVYGYEFALDEAPRIQLEPQGWRGYIEGWPVKPIK